MSAARRTSAGAEPIVVSLSWAADQLGVCVATARSLARRGELPGAFQVGNRWRVSSVVFRREIERLAEGGAERPPVAPVASPAPLAAVDRPSVPKAAPRGAQSHRGRQIAAEAPVPTITGEVPLVRRRRPSS